MQSKTPVRPKKKSSIKVEFAVWVILLVVITTVTLTWVVLKQEEAALTKEVTRRGIALAQYVATHSIDPFLADDKLTLATLVADVMKNEDMVYALIVDRNNRVVASDESSMVGQAYLRPAGSYPLDRPAPKVHSYLWQKSNEWVLDIGIPIILEGKAKIGEVHIGISQASIKNVVSDAWRNATGLAGIFVVAGLISSIVMVTWILRPVSALITGAQAIGSGNLDYRIPPMRQNELGQLAVTFNQMTEELREATEKALEQERIEKELQVAHQIQHMLLPKKNPEVQGYSFGSLYRAAKEVGGDYYDFFQVNQDQVGLVVADVCGKGVPAAMLMSVTRSTLKSLVSNDSAPVTVAKELNRALLDDLSRSLFITLFYAVIDTKKKQLRYTSAGHNPGLIWRAQSKTIEELILEPTCLPLGLDDSDIFNQLAKEQRVKINQYDVIILYTDGVTEAMNEQAEEFGIKRLYASLERYADAKDADTIIQGIDQDINRFCGQVDQSDDIAIVAVKVA